MKLIVWWIALMLVLPLAYLFWWKKRWRLLLGAIILAVLVISYLVPGEFAFSKLTTEIEKRQSPVKQLKTALRSISEEEIKPSDSEKTKCEKTIIRLNQAVWKWMEKELKGEKLNEMEVLQHYSDKLSLMVEKNKWIKRWGKQEKPSTFLFCGEQFNESLNRKKEQKGEEWQKIKSCNIIDFGQSENNKPKLLEKKLQKICEQNREDIFEGHFPTVWLKDINKIKNSEVKKKLLKIVDPEQKNNLGKYYLPEKKENGKTEQVEKVIDLSPFNLVATTSVTHPKLSNELLAKLKHIEPVLEKHKWVIFFSSMGVEVIVLVLLIRSQRKSKDRSFKNLKYY